MKESISRGKVLYTKYCLSCHGANGRGNTAIGKTIRNIPDLTNPKTKQKSDQELFDIITKGKAPMPAFKRLKEEERWDLVNYTRTFAEEEDDG